MAVYLTDAPTDDIDALWIDLARVDIVHTATGSSDAIVTTVQGEAGRFDLLSLQNGVLAALGIVDLPAGHLSQIRLVLTGAEVERAGVLEPVVVPSGAQSGLKINVDADLALGRSYEVIVDFDAAKSLHRPRGRGWMLKPVLTAEVRETGGGNQPPTALPLSVTTEDFTPVSGVLPASDPDGDTLHWALRTPSAHGAVTIDAQSGAFVFEPRAGFLGTATFGWAVSDGLVWSDEAVVTITVTLPGGEDLPPDPRLVAPAIDRSLPYDIGAANAFLYEGTVPVQQGVQPGAIETRRVAIVRGRVLDREGLPLAGVRVSIVGQAQYGWTRSREDGAYDLALSGGGEQTLRFERPGMLTVERRVVLPWREFVGVDPVVLLPLDANVTAIVPGASWWQAATGSTSVDGAGSRTAMLLVPPGTAGWVEQRGGTATALPSVWRVRLTEFTVGERGEAAMPAVLPPQVGYTYAIELSIDGVDDPEAMIHFDRPLPLVLENFRDIPVGEAVPVGVYDRRLGRWFAEPSGRVIRLVGIDSAGRAELDVTGAGVAADAGALAALGISDGERVELALRYGVGSELWRVERRRFTRPVDLNYSVECDDEHPELCVPPDSRASNGNRRGPADDRNDDNEQQCGNQCCSSGSLIGCNDHGVSQRVPLVGTPWVMRYDSRWTDGFAPNQRIDLRLAGNELRDSQIGSPVRIDDQGDSRYLDHTAMPNQVTSAQLSALDPYDRPRPGRRSVSVKVGAEFKGRQVASPTFGEPVDTSDLWGNPSLRTLVMWQHHDVQVGAIAPWTLGLRGWNIESLHTWDADGRTLYKGNGSEVVMDELGAVLRTIAGVRATPGGQTGDGGPATAARIYSPTGIVFDADGTLYIAAQTAIRRVDPAGVIWTETDFSGLGVHSPSGLALVDGRLVVAFPSQHRVLAWDLATRTWATIAGTGVAGFSGDGGPATAARLNLPRGVAGGIDGAVYILDNGNSRVRRVGLDGAIRTVVGGGTLDAPDAEPTELRLYTPGNIAVGPAGDLYVSEQQHCRVRRISPSQQSSVIAGTGLCAVPADFDQGATQTTLNRPIHVATARSGRVLISVHGTGSVAGDRALYEVQTDGSIARLAGGGDHPTAEGRPGSRLQAVVASGLAYDPMGRPCFAESSGIHTIRCLEGGLSQAWGGGEVAIADPADGLVHVFNSAGRHLRSLDRLTGAIVARFFWDSDRLIGLEDRDGKRTTIHYGADRLPTAIEGPFGQWTTLTAQGQDLTAVDLPGALREEFEYSASGLVVRHRDPSGADTLYRYDADGRLIEHVDASLAARSFAWASTTVGLEEAQQWSALGRRQAYETDRRGGRWTYRATFPSGLSSLLEMGEDGRSLSQLPDGTRTWSVEEPDARFGMAAAVRSETVELPSGLIRQSAVTRTVALAVPGDPLSLIREVETRRVEGRAWVSRYEAATRTRTATTPAGRQTVEVLDAKGRVVERRVGNLEPVTMTYDTEGLLVEIRQGSGSAARVTTMDYDAFGRLSSVLDPIGRTTGFAYDPANRLTTRTLPDAAVVAMDYDANGNMIALTPPARPAHEFDYTPVNLESSYDPPNVGLAGDVTHQYYDLDRMLTQVDRPDGTLQYGYDAAGRLAAVTAPTHTVTYGYDVDTGQLVTVSSTGGTDLDFTYDGFLRTSSTWSGLVAGSVSQTYDNSFRPIAETIAGTGGPQAISFGWDADDLLIAAGPVALSRRASDGLLASATVGAAVETYGYNAFGETTSRQSIWTGSTMYAATYTRDDLGRIATKTETIQGVTTTHAYGYDARGRLATVHTNGTLTATWGYDPNGNRISQVTPAGMTVGLVDNQDRLLAWGAASFTYDANGDLTTRADSAGVTSYDYDLFGNLRRVDLPDGDVVEYLIDGQNRRVGRVLNGAVTHKWLYKDQLNPVAELDASGNVVARFIYGTTYHAPDVMLKGGATYRLVTDHLGSVRLVVDVATGSVAQRLDYDEWGRVLVDTNPGFQPFGYAGGLYDSATGLVRFGARDYDAEVGRWTAKDPIRFAGGDENIYAYVGGDPVNLVDPTGAVGIYPPGNTDQCDEVKCYWVDTKREGGCSTGAKYFGIVPAHPSACLICVTFACTDGTSKKTCRCDPTCSLPMPPVGSGSSGGRG